MKPRPLWRCPKCGKYYVTRNMWHACARHTLDEHFAHRDPKLRLLFDGLMGLVKRSGPLKVVPGKTGIAFQVRMRFGGAVVRKNSIEAGFVLPRRIEHPRIKKVIAYTPRAYGHHVDIRTPADLDDELAGWLREAYRVGAQADLLAGKKARGPAPGEFAWSEPYEERTRRGPGQAAPRRTHPTKRPSATWKCPKCGRTLPTRNQMHICSRLTLEDALAAKSPQAVELFRKVLALARRFGPVEVVPQKTRIALQARKTFLGVKFLRNAIDCEIPLPRRIENPRFRQILSVSSGAHYHYLRIASPRELDGRARAWLREAYRSSRSTVDSRQSKGGR